MRFLFPDSQDQVNPFFDFESEELPTLRIRQRDDHYAHEALAAVPYDGILVSKAIVDGTATGAGKYSMAQTQRLYRLGVRAFFRLDRLPGRRQLTLGDCGAFNYVTDEEPPYTVDEVIDYYDGVGFDEGVAMDHIVFGYLSQRDIEEGAEPDPDWIRRRELTNSIAAEFISRCRARDVCFEPVGAAHGWDARSYQRSVKELQEMGYRRISLGGMVPLKTREIREAVRAVADVRKSETEFHLLGVTRVDHVHEFANHGVSSFDSTSPFRQAFKDDRDNYYARDERYVALRVPQVDGNPSLKKRIQAGQVRQQLALELEQRCLNALRRFDRDDGSVDECVEALRAYELVHDGKRDRSAEYRRTLEATPWKDCCCGICDRIGIEVMIFRGSERNKRRGFHNLAVFRQALDRLLAGAPARDTLPFEF